MRIIDKTVSELKEADYQLPGGNMEALFYYLKAVGPLKFITIGLPFLC